VPFHRQFITRIFDHRKFLDWEKIAAADLLCHRKQQRTSHQGRKNRFFLQAKAGNPDRIFLPVQRSDHCNVLAGNRSRFRRSGCAS
jgi:hypothetical protein